LNLSVSQLPAPIHPTSDSINTLLPKHDNMADPHHGCPGVPEPVPSDANDEEDIEGEEQVFVLINAGDGAAPLRSIVVSPRTARSPARSCSRWQWPWKVETAIEEAPVLNGLGLENATAIGAGARHAAIAIGSLVVGEDIRSAWSEFSFFGCPAGEERNSARRRCTTSACCSMLSTTCTTHTAGLPT
jgi:hypothetical protein